MFWVIYLDLLEWLHNGCDKELMDILSRHQPSAQLDQEGMDLLLNMAPFHLGHPMDVGTRVDYIGGLDISSSSSSIPVPCHKYADFTSDEESSMDNDFK